MRCQEALKRFFQNFFYNFVKVTGYIPYKLCMKTHVYYESKDTPRLGGAEIAVANHTRLLDFAMLLYLYKFRVVRVLMAEVLFQVPISGLFMRWMRGIKVNRGHGTDVEHMQEMRDALYNQDVVGIFPEGKLNPEGRDYGSLLPLGNGAIHLAMTTGARIRPLYFHNNLGVFKSCAIMVGNPIDVQGMFGSDPTPQALEKARAYLTRRLEELRDNLKLRDQHRSHSLLTRHMRWSIRIALKMGFGVTYHYTDKAVQAHKLQRNVIIVSNHRSFYDPPMLCTLFPKDKVHILAAETLYENKWLAFLLKRMGCIKIDRNCLDMESFHAIQDVLNRGASVGIFPEGTLHEDHDILPFKSSFALAAISSGVEVLPVYIGGEYKMFGNKLHIWIDTPMKLEVENLTVEAIEKQAKRVEDRMRMLAELDKKRS